MTDSTIAIAPAMTPIGRPTEKIKRAFDLDTGETLYFLCSDCDFTDASYYVINQHRHVHNGTKLGRKPGGKNKNKDPIAMIEEAMLLLRQQEENNEWKKRALAAERKVKTLRSLFKDD